MAFTLLTACQKKYCWKCATTTYMRSAPAGALFTGYTNDTTIHKFSEFDKTVAEIQAYEKTIFSDLTQGKVIVNTISTTTCNN
jgi:hypothetical protein